MKADLKPTEECTIVGAKENNGETFVPEFIIGCLPLSACQGNMAAHRALKVEKYKIDDEPFWYGKIGAFGYVYSARHLRPRRG